MISGIVLAAGRSSRLGRPKQLLELRGRPLLQQVVDAVAASPIDEIVVVLGHEAARVEEALELPADARTILNEAYAAGQSTSLIAGLSEAHPEASAAVVVLGDQPQLDPWMIEKILTAHENSGAPIVRARFGDAPGHPVLLAREVWSSFERLTGDVGGRDVIARSPQRVYEVDMGVPPLVDVDTPEDFEKLIAESD